MIDITVISIPGCQDTEPTIDLIHQMVTENDLEIAFTHRVVRSQTEAEQLKFPGSPTVLIDGVDCDPDLPQTDHYGMT